MARKVYAFCDAGCKYEVIAKEDMGDIAYKIPLKIDENGYIKLTKGQTVLVKNEVEGSIGWGFSIEVASTSSEPFTPYDTIPLPTYDKYADGVKIRLLDIYEVPDLNYNSYCIICDVNGERFTARITVDTLNATIPVDTIFVKVGVVTKAFLLNEGNELVVKGGTPERGVDYWTAADIAVIKSYVDDAILKGAW